LPGRRIKVSRISLSTVAPSPFPEVLRFASFASHILLTEQKVGAKLLSARKLSARSFAGSVLL
jgi:hypothetical protein